MAKADVIAEIGIEIAEFRTSMNQAVASIDATTEATKNLDSATKAAKKSQEDAAKVVQAQAKKTAYQTGQVAMQLQDVAVQAQMGTSALQIFAQQGSQVASVFGGLKGAVIGGAAAIGATLVSAIVASEDSFKNIIKSANDLQVELSGIASNGSLGSVTRGFEKSAEMAGKLGTEVESLGGFWRGAWEDTKALVSLGYADTQLKKIVATSVELGEIEQVNARLMERFKVAASESVKIAKLRASGENETADVLQRQLDLKIKLENIEAKNVSHEAKVRLKDLEIELAKQKEIQIQREKTEEKIEEQNEHNRKQKEEFLKFQQDEEKKAADESDKYFERKKKNEQEIDEINKDLRERQEKRDEDAAKEQDKARESAGKILQEWNDEEVEARNKRIERNKQNKESLADAIRETQIMSAQARGTSLQAKLIKSQLETEEKIAKARKEGNEELAKQLEIQRGISDLEAKVDEELKGPRQRAEERREKQRRDSARRAILTREKQQQQNPQPAAPAGVAPRPMAQPNAPAMAAKPAAGMGQTLTVETLIVKTLKPK